MCSVSFFSIALCSCIKWHIESYLCGWAQSNHKVNEKILFNHEMYKCKKNKKWDENGPGLNLKEILLNYLEMKEITFAWQL